MINNKLHLENTKRSSQFPRLLLGEAPSAEGDEGTPRTLCSHSLIIISIIYIYILH